MVNNCHQRRRKNSERRRRRPNLNHGCLIAIAGFLAALINLGGALLRLMAE